MGSNARSVGVDRIVLHIGTEKTGTSSIQDFLSKNRAALAAEGVVYPRFTGSNGGSQWGVVAAVLTQPWETEIGVRLGISDEAGADAYRQQLLEAIDDELLACPGCHTLILSSEHLHSRLSAPDRLRELKSLLGRWSENVQVLVYFRRQDRVAISLYSTKLKSGQAKPRAFHAITGDSLPYYYDYERIYANWSQVFGEKAVQAGIFAPQHLAGGDLLTDFCGRVGIAEDGKNRPAKINESLSETGVQLLLELNRQWPKEPLRGPNPSRELLVTSIAREHPGRSFPATRAQAQAFYAHFAAGNARLAKAVFPVLEGQLFDEDFSDYPEVLAPQHADLSKVVRRRIRAWRAASLMVQKIGVGRRLLSARQLLSGTAAKLKSRLGPVAGGYRGSRSGKSQVSSASATEPTQRRVFIECTHTYFAGGSSGIRRVARSLANVHKEASSNEVQLLPLVWAGRGFLRPRRPLTEARHPLLTCALVTTRGISAVAQWPLLAPLKEPIKSALCKLRQWLRRGNRQHGQAAPLAEPPLQRGHGRGKGEVFYRVFGLLAWPLGFLFVEPVRFRRGDIVVLVDSTWDSPAMLEALFAARQRDSIQVGAMLHDLFPLALPQMCQASTVAGYTGWFQQVADHVDFFITNSVATTRALEDQLQQTGPASARCLPAGNFRLGAELHQSTALSAPNPLRSLPGFVVLAVGTIEPRKNYQVILDALDLLWDKHEVSLAIVGRPGWSSDDILARLREHPQKGVRLLHLDNADDATLTACYQRADALVCASWAEGFGLPIVEGLRHGAPVLASTIDAFQEVGGDACRYFAPDRPEELAAALEQLLQQWQRGTPVRQDACDLAISWHESAVQFRDEVQRLAAASRITPSPSPSRKREGST